MSKGVKKVLSVVAAIAIPIVATPIASAIGLSGAIGSAVGSATAGSVLGSAVVGAGLGAAKAAVFNEDVKRGALTGGIGGAVSGYFNAPASTGAAASASAGSQYSLTAGLPSSTGLSAGGSGLGLSPSASSYGLTSGLSSGAGLPAGGFGGLGDYSLTAGLSAAGGGLGLSPSASGLGLSAGGLGELGELGDYSLTAGLRSGTGLSTGGSGLGLSPSASGLGLKMPNGAAATGTASGSAPTTFMEALKQVPSAIADKFKDPKMLADLTLRAAGQLAGSAFAGDGLTPEERRLLDAQTAELQKLQQTNQTLFNQRLEQAMALVGESKYFDPEYFGLQSARRAQLAGAAAKRAGLRGLTGDTRQAEARRYDLGIARNVGTAFDTGYGAGVQGRINTLTAGINAMPQQYPTSFSYYTSMRDAYANAAERRRKTQEGIGALFGSLTG